MNKLRTLVCGAIGPSQLGCQVEEVIVARGLEASEGRRGILVVLVELFDQALGGHGELGRSHSTPVRQASHC